VSAWIAPGLAPADRAVLERVLRGELPASAKVVRGRVLRRVVRLALPEAGEVFAKLHAFPYLRVRLRYALRRSPTENEREMLAPAASAGFLVPEPLAESTRRGLLGPFLAVLVTRSLGPPLRPAELREVVTTALRLGAAGFLHPDLHTDNVLVTPKGLAVVDWQSCRRRRAPLSRRHLVQVLAPCVLAASAATPAAEIAAVLDSIDGCPPAAEILARARRLAGRHRASRRRHMLRDSTRVRLEWRPRLGRRLVWRGVELPDSYGVESDQRDVRGRTWCVAMSTCGSVVRIGRRCSLRQLWLAAAAESDDDRRILAWERRGPWPFSRECLYIRIPMGGSNPAPAGIDTILKLVGSVPRSPIGSASDTDDQEP
jgi:tRNA A-37 threonylcarbamoyl transferase component Bud32